MKTFPILAACVLPLMLAACDPTPPPSSDPTQQEQAATASNQEKMINSVPLPQLQTSLERKNLARRLEHINKENQTSYIYLINYGKVMAYYAVAGKVSSLNAYLTGKERYIRDPNCQASGSDWTCPGVPVESPDLDGAYGQNDGGIFFFTTEGVYVEWNGDYMWSDQPMHLNNPPEMIMNVTK
jgi:hypothetical protein